MLRETLALGYSCSQLCKALFGLRQVWAQHTVNVLVRMLSDISKND